MKISSDKAAIIARVFERYMIYASRFMEKGFNGHPESLRNSELFIETAEDMGVIVEIYPAFSDGKSIYEGVKERNDRTLLPDPVHKDSFHPIQHPIEHPEDWSQLED